MITAKPSVVPTMSSVNECKVAAKAARQERELGRGV
jgi:hypothetical protein